MEREVRLWGDGGGDTVPVGSVIGRTQENARILRAITEKLLTVRAYPGSVGSSLIQQPFVGIVLRTKRGASENVTFSV